MSRSKTEFKPRPLFPKFPGLRKEPEINEWIEEIKVPWRDYTTWIVKATLFIHRKGARSEESYNALRSEIERFLLYLIENNISPDEATVYTISEYIDFCFSLPRHWVMSYKAHRFNPDGSVCTEWRPFFSPDAPNRSDAVVAMPASQQTLKRRFSLIKQWYEDLLDEGVVNRNPVIPARKESAHFIKTTDETVPVSLSETEWKIVFEALVEIANEDESMERALFAIALMKSCYLRISDLCSRPYFEPVMSHFYREKGYWFLKVMSKGKKMRSVSVAESFLPYLQRYRQTRGIDGLPTPNESFPIIGKAKGKGGVGKRQMDRIIKSALSKVSAKISDKDAYLAKKVKEATTHFLRHTGASIDALWRPLPELADEMGHANPSTTGKTYVNSQKVDRARSGSKRPVA